LEELRTQAGDKPSAPYARLPSLVIAKTLNRLLGYVSGAFKNVLNVVRGDMRAVAALCVATVGNYRNLLF
jgi:hypothetical protein